MKKLRITLVLALFLTAGCWNPLARIGAGPVKQNAKNWEVLGGKLTKYYEADKDLKPESKEDRILAVKEAQKLADNMKKQFEKE